jgi:hypothetical protein
MTQNELFLVIGVNMLITVSFLVIGITSYIRTRGFLRKARVIKGIVTDMIPKGSSRGGNTMYSPRVKFSSIEGKEYEVTETWSSYPPKYKRGDSATVYYDPDNPIKARITEVRGKLYFTAKLIGGLGALFLFLQLLIGAVFLIISLTIGPPEFK